MDKDNPQQALTGISLMSIGTALVIIGGGGLTIIGSILFLGSLNLPAWSIVLIALFELLTIAGASLAYLGVLFL